MDSVWDNSNNLSNDVNPNLNGDTNIIVNGSAIPLTPGDSFSDVVKRTALDAGFGKFRVFLNGVDVVPSQAPAVINEGDRIEIKPYDVAGF